jgi:hypothetical protein
MAVMAAAPRPAARARTASQQGKQHGRHRPNVRTQIVSDHEIAPVLELQQDVRYRETSRR